VDRARLHSIGEGNTPEEATTSRAARACIESAGQVGEATPYGIQVGGGTTPFTDGVFGLDDLELQPSTRRHGVWYGNWQAIAAYRASSGFGWTVMTGTRYTLRTCMAF